MAKGELCPPSSLEQLPIELVVAICDRLDVHDFKSLRLTCLALSQATRGHLAREDFTGKLWRKDPERLLQLSRIDDCSRRIRAVAFYFGQINEYKALHESFSHHYVLEPELRSEMIRDKWADYYKTRERAEAVGAFRLDLLEEAIRKLPSLTAVTLTWTQCPWPLGTEVARLFIPDVSIRMAKQKVPNIQQAVLDSLWESGVKLESLALQPFAFQGLHIPLSRGLDIGVGKASCFFGCLRSLSIVLDRKSEHVQRDGLETVLSHTPHLRELMLEYLPWSRVRDDCLFLPNTHLRDLETLEITRAETGLNSLAAFLERHSLTIRKLKMVGMRAIDGKDNEDTDDDTDDDDNDNNEDGNSGDNADVGTAAITSDEEDIATHWHDIFKLIHDKFVNLEEVGLAELFADPSGSKMWLAKDEMKVGGHGVPDNVWILPAAPLEAYLLRRTSSAPEWAVVGLG